MNPDVFEEYVGLIRSEGANTEGEHLVLAVEEALDDVLAAVRLLRFPELDDRIADERDPRARLFDLSF